MVNFSIKQQLKAYKRKYYINQLLKGLLLGLGIVLSVFLVASLLEYYNNFGRVLRTSLFIAVAGSVVYVLVMYIGKPLYGLTQLDKSLTDEEAALQIGRFFPEIKDKLLNTLQLSKLNAQENSLLNASLQQRSKELTLVQFTSAINLKGNYRYLRYVAPPLIVVLFIAAIAPSLLTDSTTRIVRFNEEFLPAAPFEFIVQEDQQKIFKNEPHTIEMAISGNVIPEDAFIEVNGVRKKMKRREIGQFYFQLSNPEEDLDFHFESAGFQSKSYDLEVVSRPNLTGFDAVLDYPNYLKRKNQTVSNVGTFRVPEGTKVSWLFKESNSEEISLKFEKENTLFQAKKAGAGLWEFSKILKQSTSYEVSLANEHGKNKEPIQFSLEVVKDAYPKIEVERHSDTTLFNFLLLGGTASDDYGISSLKLMYRTLDKSGNPKGPYQVKNLNIEAGQNSLQFYHQIDLQEMDLKEGESLEHYLAVWDNDGVNGPKSSKTGVYRIQLPTKEQMQETVEANAEKTEKELDKTLKDAKEINKNVKDLQERLKSKNRLDWQDKKMAEELIEKQNELQEQVEKLMKQYNTSKELQKRFQNNPRLQEKMESLQQLMDELLDEETKEKFRELEELLKEKTESSEDMQRILDELEKKDFNLEKELDRALEMFKQVKYEQKMQQTIDNLDSLAKEQEKLSEETKNANKQESEELKKKQEELSEKFEELKKDMEELKEMNGELENPNPMADTKEEEKSAEENMENSEEQLDKKNNKKSSDFQKKASEDLKKMAESMQAMLDMAMKQSMQEDMESLRQILENLMTLSFDQEELMKEFRQVRQRDPRFVELGQQQLKLRDDAKLIEDSLMALAKRVFQIQSFVTREVTDMNDHMKGAIDGIRDRKQNIATGKQQLAMTSINNLALLLNDVMKQMQQSMANQMKGNQMCDKPGKGKPSSKPGQGKKPSLSQMQQQLNQRIENLKKSGKSGRALSEELAQMAAEQEALRRALQEMKEKMGQLEGGQEKGGGMGGDGDPLEQLEKQMEKTEEDLVNKRLTQELIERQKDIETRLLESEKAMRERGMDEKREAKTAKEIKREIPPNFEKYLKGKDKQVELLKTISPALTPFYREQSNRYFKELSE